MSRPSPSTHREIIRGIPLAEFSEFTYQHVLKAVIHRLNIDHHCPLDRLAKYSGIALHRLDEARKIRTDRKQTELTHAEHIRLVCTCFDLGADDLALMLADYGVSDWLRSITRTESEESKNRHRMRTEEYLVRALEEIRQS